MNTTEMVVVPETERTKAQRIIDISMRALLDELQAANLLRGHVVIIAGNTTEVGGLNISMTGRRAAIADFIGSVALLMEAEFREEWRGKTRHQRLERLIDELYGCASQMNEEKREAARQLLERAQKQTEPFTPEQREEMDRLYIDLLLDECLALLKEFAEERAREAT